MLFVTFIYFKEDIAQVCAFHLAVLVPASFNMELLTQFIFIATFKTDKQQKTKVVAFRWYPRSLWVAESLWDLLTLSNSSQNQVCKDNTIPFILKGNIS